MNILEIVSMVNKFPIGSVPKGREELLSKAAIISFLARCQEQFSAIENIDEIELMVRNFLGELLTLSEGETLPSLERAVNTLKIVPGFVQDYDKVQYIKENNPNFNRTYDMIANNLGLINESPRKSR